MLFRSQKIEKQHLAIEETTARQANETRIALDLETIQTRAQARDEAFAIAIAKEQENLKKLPAGTARDQQIANINQLNKDRIAATEDYYTEVNDINIEGLALGIAIQETFGQKSTDLQKKQADATKALIEKQARERGELLLKLDNEFFALQDALARANFNKESTFGIADIKKFSTIRLELERQFEVEKARIQKEFGEKRNANIGDPEALKKIGEQEAAALKKAEIDSTTEINKARRQRILDYVNGIRDLIVGVAGILNNIAEASNRVLDKIIEERTKKIDKLNAKADAGQRISVQQLKKEEGRRETALAQQKQIADQQIAIAQAVATANAIAAIAQAASNPAGLGIGNLFLIAATIAALVAGYALAIEATSSAPIPSFGQGGIIDGKSHSEGGVMINAEGGEAVISKQNTKKYADPIQALIAGDFESYLGKHLSFAPYLPIRQRLYKYVIQRRRKY